MSKGWIGVDLDGTLAYYENWISEEHIGEPIPLMVARVKQWLAEGRDVRIFTARVSHPESTEMTKAAIRGWCLVNLGAVIPITNVKDYDMIELWDHRAVQVEQNTGRAVGHSTRGL